MSEDMTDKVRVTIDVDVDSVDLSEELAQRVVDFAAIDVTSGDDYILGQGIKGPETSEPFDSLPPQSFTSMHGASVEAYELLPAVHIIKVDPEQFEGKVKEVVYEGGFYAKNIDVKLDYEGFDCWLSNDGSCGFAISPEGELTNVFSLQNGRGKAMMQVATSLYDRLTLNCFDGYLRKFYEYCGFEEERREENYDGEGRDVVYMSYTLEA